MAFDDAVVRAYANAGPSQVFNISTRLHWGCAMSGCSKVNNLTSCPVCNAVRYCSHEHQLLHRPRHRSVCAKLKRTQATYRKEEKSLRRRFGNEILELEWGLFWRIEEASDYMRARRSLVEALLLTNSAQAVQQSLHHLLDMLKLIRKDDIGARDLVPALFLRLGQVQEAYDFCSWWASIHHTGHYEWRDLRAPYLNIKDADVFGDLDIFLGRGLNFSHLISVTLMKIRLMIDLHSLQQAREHAGPHVPREILDTIQRYSINSLIASQSKIVERDDQTVHILRLRMQIMELYQTVHTVNPHFWPALLEPGNDLKVQPTSWGQGDRSQMQLALRYNYNAWSETPGAISIIRELSSREKEQNLAVTFGPDGTASVLE
jgi:hypothetical protein